MRLSMQYAARSELEELVDRFAAEMKAKLLKKANDGWYGWDEKENIEQFSEDLLDHADLQSPNGYADVDYVDVANFAAFLWNLTAQPPEEDTP